MAKQQSLKQKAASGMVWTALQKYSTMIIQFVSGVILARLLTPHDYGCIGMITIFMVLAEAFIEGGFGSALIQKKDPTQEDYSTIFYWNIGMAIILYAAIYFSAPAIARFYDIPLLSKVLRVQGIVLFIYALNVVQNNRLRKKLNFKVLSIVTISTSFISLAITIIMAYKGFGVWSLVAQNIITAAIPAIVFWFYVKWRPSFIFSKQSFKELFGFGFYMFLTNLINKFGQQIQGLLIGRVYDSGTMGYYSKANSTERLASTSISQIMTQVTFPLYAEVKNDLKKLGATIRQLSMAVSYLTFPLMFILILCAKPIFVLLYSDRWLASVPYFQVLCLSGLAYCMQSVNYQSISAIGKSRVLFVWTFIKRTIGILLVIGGLLLAGMKGLLVGMVLNTWFAYAVNIALVSKHIGYKWWNQLRDILPTMIVSVLAFAVCYFTISRFQLSLYLDGLLKGCIYILIYVGWTLTFKPEASKNIKSIVASILNKKIQRKQAD